MNIAYNMDCMEYMRTLPDKAFDLAVVDPPYGIEKGFKDTSRIAKYGQMQTVNDAKPSAAYFAELRRISKIRSFGDTIICRICSRQPKNLFFGTSTSQ